jgi:hypothetical protein
MMMLRKAKSALVVAVVALAAPTAASAGPGCHEESGYLAGNYDPRVAGGQPRIQSRVSPGSFAPDADDGAFGNVRRNGMRAGVGRTDPRMAQSQLDPRDDDDSDGRGAFDTPDDEDGAPPRPARPRQMR